MNQSESGKRATVHDVARKAGVSLATVDRVLNERAGVRARTIEKVEAAVVALDFHRDLSASLLARSRDINIHVILPGGTNQFMANLATAISNQSRQAAAERMHITTSFVRAFDVGELCEALAELQPKECDCAIVVATDSDAVRDAVNATVTRGVAVVTLVSDLRGTARRYFIGIDNRAAGRTAASLMGRFCNGQGKVGLIAGSLDLRDHRERYEGFREIARAEFPRLHLIGPEEGFDEPGMTGACVSSLVADHPDLVGLYSMGAGNAGLIEALVATGRAGHLRVIAHELTRSTRDALNSGALDVVLDQNPEGEIRAAIAVARQIALRADRDFLAEPIEIGIFLRDNLR